LSKDGLDFLKQTSEWDKQSEILARQKAWATRTRIQVIAWHGASRSQDLRQRKGPLVYTMASQVQIRVHLDCQPI